jgi:hypothetical protein
MEEGGGHKVGWELSPKLSCRDCEGVWGLHTAVLCTSETQVPEFSLSAQQLFLLQFHSKEP